MTDSLVEKFTTAWQLAEGSDFASRMARRSLEASVAGHPELESTLRELQKPTQERLDFRITGDGVVDHSTSAEALGLLYGAIDKATRAVAKSLRGKGRWQPQLFATAPSPGSLKIRFSAPDSPTTSASLRGTEVPTWEAQALRTLANLIAQSEDEDESVLNSSAAKLPPHARSAIKGLAETTMKVQWNIESLLEGRGRGTVRATLSPAGAQRLKRAAEAITVKTDHVELSGMADGWRWSTGSLVFAPDHGRPFSASVPAHLQSTVARLIADPNAKLQARFEKTRTQPAGTDKVISTAYSLESVTKTE